MLPSHYWNPFHPSKLNIHSSKKLWLEAPVWRSELRIRRCHNCRVNLIPSPGTSTCLGCSQNKAKQNKKEGGVSPQRETRFVSSQTETRITSLRKSPGQRSGCFPTERYQGSPLRKRTEHLPSETRGSPHQKWPGCFCSDADQVNLSHKKTKLFPLRQRPALLHSEQDQNDSPQTETMVSTQKKNRA